jgi:tetratricopeptide (TPR) repeat protein
MKKIYTLIIILFGISAIYLYVRPTPEKLFVQKYRPYEPHIMRGGSKISDLKEAYSDGKMDSVLRAFKSMNSPEPEEYIMAGIAYLEKNEPTKAIETFEMLIQKNADSKSDFFEDDAEYYLAMSYLSNNESDKAMPIFEKIQADPENPYNSNVNEWFLMNVKYSIAKR